MIPDSNIFSEEVDNFEYPTETYKIEVTMQPIHSIKGMADDLEAIKQAVYVLAFEVPDKM